MALLFANCDLTGARRANEVRARRAAIYALLAQSRQYALTVGSGNAAACSAVRHAFAEILIEVVADHAEHILYAVAAPRHLGVAPLPARER